MTSDDKGNVPRPESIEEESAAVEDVIGHPALPMDRYHLRVPTFCGEEDVQQFIAEFSNVAAICRWPARVTLIQLRLCLTGLAKPYGIGQGDDRIFKALRARFGLTARDARVQLQRSKHDPKTVL